MYRITLTDTNSHKKYLDYYNYRDYYEAYKAIEAALAFANATHTFLSGEEIDEQEEAKS